MNHTNKRRGARKTSGKFVVLGVAAGVYCLATAGASGLIMAATDMSVQAKSISHGSGHTNVGRVTGGHAQVGYGAGHARVGVHYAGRGRGHFWHGRWYGYGWHDRWYGYGRHGRWYGYGWHGYGWRGYGWRGRWHGYGWRDRWYGYGVGPCWRRTPTGYIWICR